MEPCRNVQSHGVRQRSAERVRAIGGGILVRLRRLGCGGCRIVVSTVYDPSDGTGRAPGSALPAWPQGPCWVQSLPGDYVNQ